MIVTQSCIGNVTQTEFTAGDALQSGEFEWVGAWFIEWAGKNPQRSLYLYHFGGIYGGCIFGEVADFHTLAEFADCADQIAAEMWHQWQNA